MGVMMGKGHSAQPAEREDTPNVMAYQGSREI